MDLPPGRLGSVTVRSTDAGGYQADGRVGLPDGGSKRVRASGSTKGQARARLYERAEVIATTAKHQGHSRAGLTLRDIVETRLDLLRDENRLRPQSIAEYEKAVRTLVETYGHESADSFTVATLTQAMRFVYSTRPATWRQARVVLRGAYKDALESGVIQSNPARDLGAPAKKLPQPRALSPDQVAALLYALRTPVLNERGLEVGRRHNVYSDAGTLQFATGLRIGEVCALRWVDVELTHERVVLHVHGTVVSRNQAIIQEHPKTAGSIRSVSTPDAHVRQMIARRRNDNSAHPELVFPGDRGGILSPHTVQAKWRRARTAVGLPPGVVTPHIARRTRVTSLRAGGWSFEDIADAVGHRDPGTSRRIYTENRPRVIALD